jgi:hypothetical protein
VDICHTQCDFNEKWIDIASLDFRYLDEDFKLPPDIVDIKIAQSRLTGMKCDERILIKEICQGQILIAKNASIYLLPKQKDPDGKELPSPDALVNGILFEFKNVTGSIKKVEKHFRKSRDQCENVYLKIDNPKISKEDVVLKIKAILGDENYRGGTNGELIIYLAQTEKIYFMRIKELI